MESTEPNIGSVGAASLPGWLVPAGSSVASSSTEGDAAQAPRTAVNQAPYGGSDYPFSTKCDLAGGVLDAYFSYEDNDGTKALPFTLTFTGTSFTIKDANANTLAEHIIVLATGYTIWGSRIVYEWVTESSVFRVVVRYDLLSTGTGTLDLRTCNRLPARVKSIRVGLVTMTENIQFAAGKNIELAGTETERIDGERFVNQIAMDAVPGAGEGRVDGCEETELFIRRINRTPPDCAGNFVIEADECFRAQLPLQITDNGGSRIATYSLEGYSAEEAASALTLNSDCQACCPCEFYVRTYKGLKRVWEQWRAVANEAEDVRDTLNSNLDRWTAQRDCRIANPARLVLDVEPKSRAFVGGSYCNLTNCCLGPVEIRFTIELLSGSDVIEWNSGAMTVAYISGSHTKGNEQRYTPLQSGQVFRFFFDYANAQDASIAKGRLCVQNPQQLESGDVEIDAIRVTMTVHTADPIPNQHTGEVCTLPTETVPGNIQDIWNASIGGDPGTATTRVVLEGTVTLDIDPAQADCSAC